MNYLVYALFPLLLLSPPLRADTAETDYQKWSTLLATGRVQVQIGNLEQAVQLFESAANLAKPYARFPSIRHLETQSELCVVYRLLKHYSLANQTCQNTFRALRAAHFQSSYAFANTSLNLALLRFEQQEYGQAQRLSNTALVACRENHKYFPHLYHQAIILSAKLSEIFGDYENAELQLAGYLRDDLGQIPRTHDYVVSAQRNLNRIRNKRGRFFVENVPARLAGISEYFYEVAAAQHELHNLETQRSISRSNGIRWNAQVESELGRRIFSQQQVLRVKQSKITIQDAFRAIQYELILEPAVYQAVSQTILNAIKQKIVKIYK